MHAFITNPDNNVLFHSYFDVEAGDGKHQLSPGLHNHQTLFPKASVRFKELFGLPAGSVPPPAPAPVAPAPSQAGPKDGASIPSAK
jgi:hypothetical protein